MGVRHGSLAGVMVALAIGGAAQAAETLPAGCERLDDSTVRCVYSDANVNLDAGGKATLTVPSTATSYAIEAIGGPGYNSTSTSGRGARAVSTFSASVGLTLTIVVGGAGEHNAGGRNGGGAGCGGGGGASDVRTSPSPDDRIVVGAGGGGRGCAGYAGSAASFGGPAGDADADGQDGSAAPDGGIHAPTLFPGRGGRAGTNLAGGSGGAGGYSSSGNCSVGAVGTDGTATGGAGGGVSGVHAGGGGGGGVHGGGGGGEACTSTSTGYSSGAGGGGGGASMYNVDRQLDTTGVPKVTITVSSWWRPGILQITTTALGPFTTGQAVTQPVAWSDTRSGGAPSFAVSAGALPPGLALGSDGTLSGMPTTAGSYGVTIAATNAYETVTRDYAVTVDAPATDTGTNAGTTTTTTTTPSPGTTDPPPTSPGGADASTGSSTPAGGDSSTTSPSVPVLARLVGARRHKAKLFAVLRCPATATGGCAGTLRLTLRLPNGRRLALGRVRYALDAGTTRRFAVAVPRGARTTLKTARRPRLSEAGVTASVPIKNG